MDNHQLKRVSKFLSLVLRHKPETIGLTLDANGWTSINSLLEKMKGRGFELTPDQLNKVVEGNDKRRFSFSADMLSIRANQGHSINVDLDLEERTPPDELYHGTAEKNLSSIQNHGLIKGIRHHVHLSPDKMTAKKVGQRYGKPVILKVDAQKMHGEGLKFYISENGVWLTETVPAQFIEF